MGIVVTGDRVLRMALRIDTNLQGRIAICVNGIEEPTASLQACLTVNGV
jgi:hypothetical protein